MIVYLDKCSSYGFFVKNETSAFVSPKDKRIARDSRGCMKYLHIKIVQSHGKKKSKKKVQSFIAVTLGYVKSYSLAQGFNSEK